MRLREIAERLGLAVAAQGRGLDTEVTGGYCSDLLSDVMAHAREGNVWITIQTHQNVIAVGSLTAVAGVVITGGFAPEPETLAKAEREGLTLLQTREGSFETAGRIHALLCRHL
ncbi:MAG TPA: DRTGG domain-containing protein [Bacillota bacterium]